ncbi:hypothetical protein, partial [Pseudomonas syringae group genomosp. 7]|uniref:hypothetical protein n=1 Tax=Pseudomonas syringae group genomosp. 7 TaxID=251699 RepID=UPI00376FAEF9
FVGDGVGFRGVVFFFWCVVVFVCFGVLFVVWVGVVGGVVLVVVGGGFGGGGWFVGGVGVVFGVWWGVGVWVVVVVCGIFSLWECEGLLNRFHAD